MQSRDLRGNLRRIDRFILQQYVLIGLSQFYSKAARIIPYNLKETPNESEFIVKCDFSENDCTVLQNEAHSCHWTSLQELSERFVIVSDCLQHNSSLFLHLPKKAHFISNQNQRIFKNN